MGLQVYALRKKVRALTDARKGGREHLMSLLLQNFANPLPAPAAVPSPMNQNKSLCHLNPLRQSRDLSRRERRKKPPDS